MKIGSSTNPALKTGFEKVVSDSTQMTISGTIAKIFILLAVLTFGFVYSWNYIPYSPKIMVGVSVLTFIVALITTFMPKIARFSAIIYAAFEGVFLGCISNLFNIIYPGIILPAIILTLVCVAVTVLVYGRHPSVAARIRKGVTIGLITILVASLISFILSMFGVTSPIYGNGFIGIGFSLFVVFVATLSLMQDYDFIVRGSQSGAPKYMEWYGAFGLMVTLVWLYLEILQLIAKIISSND